MRLKTVNIKNDVLTLGHDTQNTAYTKTASINDTRNRPQSSLCTAVHTNTLSPHKPSSNEFTKNSSRHPTSALRNIVLSLILSARVTDRLQYCEEQPSWTIYHETCIHQIKKVNNQSRTFHDTRTKNYISVGPKWKPVYSIYGHNFYLNRGSSTTANVKVKLSSESRNTVQFPRPQKWKCLFA
jgi:hypothetical protein